MVNIIYNLYVIVISVLLCVVYFKYRDECIKNRELVFKYITLFRKSRKGCFIRYYDEYDKSRYRFFVYIDNMLVLKTNNVHEIVRVIDERFLPKNN